MPPEYCLKGSRFLRREPVNNTGSWGRIEIRDRRSCKPTVLMSMPSMRMDPSARSIMRNKVRKNDDLPDPATHVCLQNSCSKSAQHTSSADNPSHLPWLNLNGYVLQYQRSVFKVSHRHVLNLDTSLVVQRSEHGWLTLDKYTVWGSRSLPEMAMKDQLRWACRFPLAQFR